MEQVPISPKGAEAVVMGTSRSGRKLKKSSKLMDFQSPDDIDTKVKKVGPSKQHHKSQLSPVSASYSNIKVEPDLDLSPTEYLISSVDSESELVVSNSMDTDEDEEDSSGTEDQLNQNLLIESSAKKSIYITEKSTKKKIMKDGKIIMSKAQRKDKGKSRFTAYMLWAKDVRQEMLYNHPELDFAAISKRLGEMWANVPSGEKYNWKRRAKRLAAKGKELPKASGKLSNPSKFINKGSPFKPTKRPVGRPISGVPTQSLISNVKSVASTGIGIIEAASASSSIPSTSTKTNNNSGHYKITGYQPADVAAYLKLLGDSLTIIGERLKEHEGQITVSGSLSVLLDSLLCSIGPLMCLTINIPSLASGNQIANTKELLQNILDNIAYVMPGL